MKKHLEFLNSAVYVARIAQQVLCYHWDITRPGSLKVLTALRQRTLLKNLKIVNSLCHRVFRTFHAIDCSAGMILCIFLDGIYQK